MTSENVLPFKSRLFAFFFLLDAILNMVNNIAANVLGGASELGGELVTGGTRPSHSSRFLFSVCPKAQLVNAAFGHFTRRSFLFIIPCNKTKLVSATTAFFGGENVHLIPFCIFLTYLREAVSEISFKLCYIFIYS